MFLDRLKATLVLTIAGEKFTVVAGNIKALDLDIKPWGYTGRAEFWLVSLAEQSEDELFAKFVKKDLIEVAITMQRAFDEVDEDSVTITMKGLVTEKRVMERAFSQVATEPVLQRRYEIKFGDRGQVLWRQHHPNALYVDKTLKDLIEDNKPKGVTIEYTWAKATVKHPVLSLGLGTALGEASFYDYLFWLAHKENAAIYYDSVADKYSVVGAKPAAEGEPEDLERRMVDVIETHFPATRRSMVAVLNAYSEAGTRKKEIANTDKVDGVRRDYLIRSSIGDDITKRATLETDRQKHLEPEVRLTLRAYPAKALKPSMQVKLVEDWSEKIFSQGKKFRVASTKINARAALQEATADTDDENNSYEIDYEVMLELDTDPIFRYPAFREPHWPIHVEGKVVSEVGADAEGTYQPYTDSTTNIDFYKVQIPLWADQKVIAFFEPNLLSGHFYFPAYKHERVLVGLHFDTAQIVAFLDWRPGARLPLDTQGNHILVGKQAKNETSIRHVYEDAKPALTILRSSAKDLQTIKVSEGTIWIETKDTE